MERINFEKGSMAVFVGIVLLGMLFIVMSVFLISNNSLQAQAESLIKIKEAYEVDVNNVDEIYQNLTGTTTDEPQYVTDGLVLHYDAINNTGEGHNSSTTTWKDLSGNGNDGTLSTSPTTSNFYWEDNSITISGYSSGDLKYYVDTPLNLSEQERTYIYTIDATNLTGSIWGETDSSNRNGLFNYHQYICNRANSTSGDNKINYTFSKSEIYNYAVSVSSSQIKFYENGQLITTINNTVGLKANNTLRLLAARYSNQNATNLKMYNFMAYNRALTDEEVQNNFTVDKSKYNIISDTSHYVTDGLVLHYDAINNTGEGHSDTTSTWKDLSGNGNDGSITGGTWQSNALRFTSSNENNGVETSSNFPIDFSNTFNIVFKLSSLQEVDPLFGARTSTSNGFMLFNYQTNNGLTLDTKGSNTRIMLGDRLSANTTYDLTVTFSGTTVKLYINGQLIKTMSFTDASINFPLTIFTAATRSNALGNIYSVKVYDRALSDDEVVQNYNIDKEKYDL